MNHEGMISQHLTTQQDHLRKKTKRIISRLVPPLGRSSPWVSPASESPMHGASSPKAVEKVAQVL